MGVRDRLTTLAKVFGGRTPAEMRAGEEQAQMTPASPFSPGQPISPYDGYSRTPRTQNFTTGHNISARPKSGERVSFDALRGLVEAYDVAQMCIWHRIDSIRAVDWSVVPAPGFTGDADTAIATAMAVLERPDRQTRFSNWLAKYLYDVLAYDAGTLYRMRNRGGRAIGLRVVEGTTIAPLIDYWGNSPEPPTEAYVQYANGLPWGWLTRNDLIYEPFRPRSNSLYGTAPLESILLNANTDLRFQAHFLQKFTDGNIPKAFASAPENWTPDQIEQFQTVWDALMMGDQSIQSQIKWIPGGSKIEWSSEQDFSDAFSLFLMRKTCAAYHVVPADLGFTETVNRSSGETQADVQHRVGDLPLINHMQGILTDFLRHDLGLPLSFKFDTGQEKDDRLQEAQAWGIYIDKGMASADEGREKLLGLPSDPHRPTPRFINTTRLGPIPLLAIEGVAGKVDPETFGPADNQPVLPQPYVPPIGTIPAAGTADAAAATGAEDSYQTAVRQELQADAGQQAAAAPVTKDATPAAPTAGITAGTGLYGYDLVRDDDTDDEDDEPKAGPAVGQTDLAKAELAAFRRFRAGRRRARTWRDFQFHATDPVTAHRLNDAGRLAIRKAAGDIAVAGLAVRAADTGRVLMLQRALDPDDPAAGTWEFPGGHIEGDEQPLHAAVREWSEETGCVLPFSPDAMTALAFGQGATWINGIYQGFVYEVPSETAVPVHTGRDQVTNPDDPDGDQVEAIAWWDPGQLHGNPAVRPELLASLPAVLAALGDPPAAAGTGSPAEGDEDVCPCGIAVVYDEANGWQHTDGSVSHDDGQSVSDKMPPVAKAGGASPKGPAWPGWDLDREAAAHWAPKIADAFARSVDTRALAAAWIRHTAGLLTKSTDDDSDIDDAEGWLRAQDLDLENLLSGVLYGVWVDGYLIGVISARALLTHEPVGPGDWVPGDTDAARAILGAAGDGAGLRALLDDAAITITSVADTKMGAMAKALADGAARGDSVDTIARNLDGLLTNPARADMIATTELCRAISAASLNTYLANGVERVEWVSAGDGRVCAICQNNADAGGRRPGAVFPSGHTQPPAHPLDRCALVPVTSQHTEVT